MQKPANHAAVVREARSWLRTPHIHLGRYKGLAIDCIGLIFLTGRNCGLVSDYPDQPYGRWPDGVRLKRDCDLYLVKLEIPDLLNPERGGAQPGDILMMKWRRYPSHLAIMADRGYPISIIHSHATVGFCVEHNLDDEWRAAICGVYRYPGLA